jgi:antitoxin (DNA-binding transcriptional repressor) of toxin-antitoxin stability system
MIHQYTTSEAKKRLKDLVDAALRGETVRIVKDNHSGVELVPLPPSKGPRKFGSAKGLIIMSDDFNAPLADFDEYTA